MSAKKERPYTVIVGVSDSSKSPVALTWAAAQAERFSGRVVAVRARPASASGPSTKPTRSRSTGPETRQPTAQLRADVAESLGPDHGVDCRVITGGRLKVLLAAAEDADLLVIDAPRAINLLSGPLFANRVVYRAACPVVVMPPGISGEPRTWLARAARGAGTTARATIGVRQRANKKR